MKKNYCLLALLACCIITVSAQDVFRAGGTGEYLRSKPVSGSKAQEVYIDTAWAKTSILIDKYEKPSEEVLARYDLRANQLEIKTPKGVNVLDTRIVKTYTSVDKISRKHEFVNGKTFKVDGAPLNSMIEVLYTGKISVYKRYNYYLKKPDFNPALSVGNPDEQVFMEDDLYYAQGENLLKIPTKKKKLLVIFGDKAPQVESFIDKNDINISKEAQLVKVFEYYNTL